MLEKLQNKLNNIALEKETVAARIQSAEQRLIELNGAEEAVQALIDEAKQEASASASYNPE